MNKIAIRSVVLLLFCALLGVSRANAWFKFCSQYPASVWVMFEWYHPHCSDGGNWEKEGWWQLSPGQCKTVFGSNLQSTNRYYYYYAEAADGASWTGLYPECVTNQRFDWCENTCSTGGRTVGMREIDIQSYNNYTLTLVP